MIDFLPKRWNFSPDVDLDPARGRGLQPRLTRLRQHAASSANATRRRVPGIAGGLCLTVFLIVCLGASDALADEAARGSAGLVPDITIGIDSAAAGLYAGVAGALQGTPIGVPADAYTRPPRLYVLPVIVAPAGYGAWLPDAANPGFDLNGDPFVHPGHAATFERVANNLSVHLQTARKMYREMMRNPLNGDTRGTFNLATWDAVNGLARRVPSQNTQIRPLVMQLQNYTVADIVALGQTQPWATPHWVEEILDTLGCQRMTCPFVLSIVVVGDPFNPVHGAKWNYGYNNGGGGAYFNYATVKKSWSTNPAGGHNFLSTLVHELGHAFGMPHSNDYCNVVNDCASHERFDLFASASIMSYNEDNQIFGCPRASALDQTHCLLPADRVIVMLPGALEREDKRLLDRNTLVFPDFEYLPALDHPAPTDPVYRLDAGGDWEITTSGRLLIGSPDSHPATARPSVLIGGHSERFIDIEENNFLRTWVSSAGPFGSWAQLEIVLPADFTLKRLRIYGGHYGDSDRPTGLQLFEAGDPNPIASKYNLFGANHDLHTSRTGSHFVLQMQRGASGLARLRGLRIFGNVVGTSETMELYPPAEPVASTDFGSAFGGSIDHIVGSDQFIANASIPFQPQASWHSSARTPGSWVSVDVDLREEMQLRGMTVSSGHTGGVHRAQQIQIERECVCRHPYSGAGGSCGSQSIAQCNLAGGIGERVYEVVKWDPDPLLDDYIDFPNTTARRWRVAMKTADGAAGSSSWMVVRALRLWAPGAAAPREIFPYSGTIN